MTYKVFTTKYDREVDISEYAEDFRKIHDMNSVERTLTEAKAGIAKSTQIPGKEPLLMMLDCSGSMRGGSLVSAIAGLRAAGDAFEKEGRPFEILGFTTDKWKGGRSREDWLEAGRPQLPGRLNDLLHINIKRFDEDWTQASKNMVGLLSSGLIKENIDGEALMWGFERAQAKHPNASMIVVSDGAPVDDSTLSVNPANYLQAHLDETIQDLSSKGMKISAVVICDQKSEIKTSWPHVSPAEYSGITVGLNPELTANIFAGISTGIQAMDASPTPVGLAKMPTKDEDLKEIELHRFIIGVRGTVDDSDYIIDAPDPKAAAMIYLEKSLSEGKDGIFVDQQEILEIGTIDCRQLSAPLQLGVIDWEDIPRSEFEIEELIPDYGQRAGLTDEAEPEL
ncbi:MAG: hypothetical protein ABJN42_13635 [Roseibium sp.]|uniref:cobaltochelatase CobT-related protein n=1 Tax=Roseibium sp. TaxID=1936156 RepID=UPI003299DEA8